MDFVLHKIMILAGVLMLCALPQFVEAQVFFSKLPRTLEVEAEILNQVPATGIATAGEDFLAIRWVVNSTLQKISPDVDSSYAKVSVKLCYAPVSQVDRGWRKKSDNLHKDKTCSRAIVAQKYTSSSGNSTVWRITKDVPGAIYFVRAYALNANGTQVGYGQTTNAARTTNLITIIPISGRLASIDVAAAVFSAFSVGALLFFLTLEKIKSKQSSSKP